MSCGGSHENNANAATISETVKDVNDRVTTEAVAGEAAHVGKSTRDEDGLTVIPDGAHAGENLSDIRSQLSGYHFSKEAMDPQAVRVLLLAEALLAVLDAEDPRGYRH